MGITVQRLDHVAIEVSDLARSINWYQSVLGLKRCFEEFWGSKPVFLCAGGSCLALFAREEPRKNSGLAHIAFRVTEAELAAAGDLLRKSGIPFTSEDHQISKSIYFSDPDGNALEITAYAEPIS